MFAFRFAATQEIVEIYQIRYLTLNSQGQDHGQDRVDA